MTEHTTAAQAIAGAMSSLVGQHDVGDLLADLVADCARFYPAAAVAVLVGDRRGDLELLSATSHRAEELELLQVQHDRGPCVDAVTTHQLVVASGAEMERRWGTVGAAIRDAGFEAVHAFPMRWRGRYLGGLNIFLAHPGELSPDAEALGHLFADMATLTVVHSSDIPADQIAARIHEAVSARASIEQAKGVLAYQRQVDAATAYELLAARARSTGSTLSETARLLVERAARGQAPLGG
jgi:hypothetical protein